MEFIIVANDLEHVELLSKLNIDKVIVSSKYSSYRTEFSLSQIEKSFEIYSDLYVSFYDLISESIIDEVIDYINKLLEVGIKNFVVNDLGIIHYLRQFNANVIYDNITITTNYETINILKNYGIDGFVIGREATLEEINEIANNSRAKTIVHIQGMFPIFTSIRPLVSNYIEAKSADVKDSGFSLYQRDRGVKYPIIEKDNGVIMFSSYEQCGIEDISKLDVDYLLIDQPFVTNSESIDIINLYLDYSNYSLGDVANISRYRQSRGFFYKKTMYKL